jgi:hypothetical protein
MKYNIVNKINIKLFIEQVGWLGGKGFEFHPWDSMIKFHEWHVLHLN